MASIASSPSVNLEFAWLWEIRKHRNWQKLLLSMFFWDTGWPMPTLWVKNLIMSFWQCWPNFLALQSYVRAGTGHRRMLFAKYGIVVSTTFCQMCKTTLRVKKQDTKLLPITSQSANVDRFPKYFCFAVWLCGKFATTHIYMFHHALHMSLHCLVKYLCSNNHNAQEVIEANCHVRLSHWKNCFKTFVWYNIHYLIHQQKMFTQAI